jgi:hypothetical protein
MRFCGGGGFVGGVKGENFFGVYSRCSSSFCRLPVHQRYIFPSYITLALSAPLMLVPPAPPELGQFVENILLKR